MKLFFLSKEIELTPFLKNNLIFFIGSLATSFVSYLFYPLLARLMTTGDFGEVQALLSLSLQFSVFLGAFSLVSINVVANTEDEDIRIATVAIIQKAIIVLSIFLFVLAIIFSHSLQIFFNFPSYRPFISLAFLLPAAGIFTVKSSVLQGLHDFFNTALANFIIAVARLVLALLLVYFGWRSGGAITAIVIGQVLGLIFLLFKTKRHFKKVPESSSILAMNKERVFAGVRYAFYVFLGVGLVTFLYSGDILVVKHFFDPDTAGLYAGISTIAKIVFFIVAPITSVLFPNVKLKNSKTENEQYFLKSFYLIFLLGGATLLVFYLLPNFITHILIGTRYIVFSSLLPRLALVMFLSSFINLFLYYFLSLRRYYLVLILILGIGGNIFLNFCFHASLLGVINNFLYTNIFIIFALGIFSIKRIWQN